jgi:serine/threonine protein kinase
MTICGTDEYMAPELMLDEVRGHRLTRYDYLSIDGNIREDVSALSPSPRTRCSSIDGGGRTMWQDYSTPADMFSFGLVLLEVIARRKVGDRGFASRPVTSLFALGKAASRPCCTPT